MSKLNVGSKVLAPGHVARLTWWNELAQIWMSPRYLTRWELNHACKWLHGHDIPYRYQFVGQSNITYQSVPGEAGITRLDYSIG